MYAFISGKYILKTPSYVWMEANGIGFEIHISLHTYSQIQHDVQGKLLTYFLIKEDAHSLFGFFDDEELTIFKHLISVSGVGASTARIMLSSMKPSEIHQAIINENEFLLSKIKGLGPKTVKRLILELKDKLLKLKSSAILQGVSHNNIEDDALNALISLGIARNTAYAAMQKVLKTENNLELENLIKLSLKNI